MRRKRYIESKKTSLNKKGRIAAIAILLLVLLVSAVAIIWIKISTLPKYSFLYREEKTGDIFIYLVDSKKDFIKKYRLNGDIILNSSYGYGEYSLKNLWLLAEKEGRGGELVVSSVVKNFGLPVHYFLDYKGTNMNPFYLMKSKMIVSSNLQTDSSFSSFDLNRFVIVDFVEQDIQDLSIGVEIDDLTGDISVSDKVSLVVNNLGSKVVYFSKGYSENLDCEVIAASKNALSIKLVKVFDCKLILEEETKNIKLRIGRIFLERF